MEENLKEHCVTFSRQVVKKQNCMYLVEEHCLICTFALCDCVDEYDYPTAHKTFTTRLKRYNQLRWKGSQAD